MLRESYNSDPEPNLKNYKSDPNLQNKTWIRNSVGHTALAAFQGCGSRSGYFSIKSYWVEIRLDLDPGPGFFKDRIRIFLKSVSGQLHPDWPAC